MASRRTSVHDKCRTTKGNPQESKCSTVINGNYYAGTNEEMKTILQGIQAQLTDLQELLRDMKTEKENKTGKKFNTNFFCLLKSVSLEQLVVSSLCIFSG